MNKPKIIGLSPDDKYSPENVAKNNAEVRAKANPIIRNLMDEVGRAIDQENDSMNARLEQETALRAWAKNLLGVQVTMSEIEDLRTKSKKVPPGQPFIFSVRKIDSQGNGWVDDIHLFKTAFGVVDRLENYVHALEKTIIDLSKKIQQEPILASVELREQFTEETFFGLMKLAFKRLLKRRK